MSNPADLAEQSQWDFFWVPADVRIVDRPELLYACCPRDIPLLNCVTRTRPTGAVEPLVEEVVAAHQGVTSRWLVRDRPEDERVASALEAAGYRRAYHHHACALAVAPMAGDSIERAPRRAAGTSGRVGHVGQVTTMKGLVDWYTVADAVFGSPEAHPADELETFLAECTRVGARVHRFVAYDGDEPVSCGGMTSFAALGFGYLWAGATLPHARGRGHYRAVVDARVRHAARLGLRQVGLYARVASSSPIVERLGFGRYGSMTYWERAL